MTVGSNAPSSGAKPLTVQVETPQSWRAAVDFAIDDGWRFASMYATTNQLNPALVVTFTSGVDRLVYICSSSDARIPTIIDLVPAAVWDEREAHDLFGWNFTGHDPMRPLVSHPDTSAEWMTTVRGSDVHQVAVGPIHAGVIESGHFRFHVVGERVLHLDLQLFHKHRGLELAAQGNTFADGLGYVQRACAADSVANSVAYVDACERILGLEPRLGIRRIRTTLLELERVYNHLHDISAVFSGVGFTPGSMLFATLKERAQRLNAKLTGHRFLFNSVCLASSSVSISKSEASTARTELAEIGALFNSAWRGVQFAGSAQERFEEVGVVSSEDAIQLGAVGPAARAAGIEIDARMNSSRLHYPDFVVAQPFESRGDVRARFEMRGAELTQSLSILDELFGGSLTPDGVDDSWTPAQLGIGVVESPRGQTVCSVEAQSGLIERMHLRTGSYANWPVLAHSVRGSLIADFPLINKSFELCYACVDR